MNTYILLKKIALFYNKKICNFLPFKQLFFFWNSSYVRNKIIIKFRPQALRLNLLCYQYPGPPFNKENGDKPLNSLPELFRSALMSQRFYVDDLIADSSLLRTIKSFGGDTLRRITFANPCADTISISRYGDTLHSEDYLWMVLHINNDTSVINGCIFLLYGYSNLVDIAQPNFFLYPDEERYPTDEYYQYQESLRLCGLPFAWSFAYGNPEIKIGIVDTGVDWQHCDFNTPEVTSYEQGYKIEHGWSFPHNASGEALFCYRNPYEGPSSGHGTSVCGIIGALTSNLCSTGASGISGIVGGWGTEPAVPIGCRLFVYRTCTNIPYNGRWPLLESYVIGAIRELASSRFDEEHGIWRGFGVHIINNSYHLPLNGGIEFIDEGLRSAIDYAYLHGVVIVASRSNGNTEEKVYPASIFPNNWIVCTGGSKRNKNRSTTSKFGNGLDLIAPLTEVGVPNENNIYTTQYGGGFTYFEGTSASAAHVTGVIALLQSYFLQTGTTISNIEPEDWENMLKASALDRNPENINEEDPNGNYLFFYDKVSGWGHLQADRLFDLILRGYKISHFSIPLSDWLNPTRKIINTRNGRVVEGVFPFVREISRKNYEEPERSIYYGNVLELTGEFELPTNKWLINGENKLYIWGRSGGKNKPGGYLEPKVAEVQLFSDKINYEPSYWTGYIRVLSSYGGNGIVDGIFYDHSLKVKFAVYQYELKEESGNAYKQFPPSEDLCAYIAVFGLEKPIEPPNNIEFGSGVINNQLKAFCFIDRSSNKITVGFFLSNSSNGVIKVYDIWGNCIADLGCDFYYKGFNSKIINLEGLSNGIYFIKISTTNAHQVVSFCIYE